jgi:hypothetical protein
MKHARQHPPDCSEDDRHADGGIELVVHDLLSKIDPARTCNRRYIVTAWGRISMAYGDPKMPRSVLRGENVFVGDDKEPYTRDSEYWMYLEITDLSISGGLEADDIGDARSAKRPVRETLSGRAKLSRKDT